MNIILNKIEEYTNQRISIEYNLGATTVQRFNR